MKISNDYWLLICKSVVTSDNSNMQTVHDGIIRNYGNAVLLPVMETI